MQRSTRDTAGQDGPSSGAAGATATTMTPHATSASVTTGPRREPGLIDAIPPLATLAVMLWGIQGASYGRDEAATLAAVHRTFPQLLHLLGFVDAVHGAYYCVIWVMVHLFGTGELAVRLPSALAMAAAAWGITVIGRRLISRWAGLAAGLTLAALPEVSWFGQYARSPAIVAASATGATYRCIRARAAHDAAGAAAGPARGSVPEAAARRSRRRWLIAYAAGLLALGLFNLFGLLLVAAHAATLALRWRRDDPGWRRLAAGWLAAVIAAVVLLSPLIALDVKESWQVRWITKPGLAQVRGLLGLIGSPALFLVGAAVVAAGIAVSVLFRQRRTTSQWPRSLFELTLPWLILPGAILLAVSAVKPVYEFRYVVFCIPAAALLIGAALAALGRVAGPAALAVIVLLAAPAQFSARGPAGHGDNVRGLQQIVAAQERPGDVVFYLDDGAGTFAYAYPYGLIKLPVIAQRLTPVQAATLTGRLEPVKVVRQRLTRVPRLWVVEFNHLQPFHLLDGLNFRLARRWQVSDLYLELYVRQTG